MQRGYAMRFSTLFRIAAVSLIVGLSGLTPGQEAQLARAVGAGKDGDVLAFQHEIWGQTYYGNGYVYGPTAWRSSMAVVDIDGDGDNDFAFRANYHVPPQAMRNLGTSGTFYPGGLKDLNVSDPVQDQVYLDVIMDFEDVTRDGRPDLVAVANRFDAPYETYIVWYRNEGPSPGDPRDEPQFVFMGYVYTSSQNSLPELSLNLADIDDDGLVDLFFVEPFLAAPPYPHRVFFMKNVGTPQMPSWANPQEVTALSALMPPGIEVTTKAGQRPDAGLRMPDPLRQHRVAAKGTRLDVRVSDIELCDWDVDGLRDFLFYDALQGIDWVRNTGASTEPAWDDELNVTLRAPWRHTDLEAYGIPADSYIEMDKVYGTFAVRTNPEAGLPGTKWLDDCYINMEGWLITRRYFKGANEGYRLTQENCLEYPTGQGPPALWDCDGDGDLDLFRSGVGADEASMLMLFENVGTPYAPAWGPYMTVPDTYIHKGTEANHYRQDMYAFADADGDGSTEFFIQRQDGTVSHYAATGGLPPTLVLVEENMADVVMAGVTGVQPRGLAVADFNHSEDGYLELMVAYASDDGGRLIYVSQALGSGGGVLTWDTPVDMSTYLLDESDNVLSPNRIESLGAGDLDLDGRVDLIVTLADCEGLSDDDVYYHCSHHFYRNTYNAGADTFSFEYTGRIDAPVDSDGTGNRMIALADIDADSDVDLFIGHQVYYPEVLPRRHHLRFYRNACETGLAFWRTRIVADNSWQLFVEGANPRLSYVANASGGWLGIHGWYTAGPTSRVVDIIETIDLDPNYRVFVDVLPEVGVDESKAIVVAGGETSDSLYPTFQELAGDVYWVLRNQGLPKINIRLLAELPIDVDQDGTQDNYGPPWKSMLQDSILEWAAGADRLVVVLMDHGQRDRFRLGASSYLEADEYGGWLNQVQAGGGPEVTTIIDMCEAGSFVDDLALDLKARKSGARRITITSSGIGPLDGVAMFDRHGISFSAAFWHEIYQGGTYGAAFEMAKLVMNAVNPLQMPQINDDGNGQPNQASDGLVANEARPGADFEVVSGGVFIGRVAEFLAVTSNQATLWLADVVTDFPVEAAGALIVPPNFQRPALQGDDEQPVTGLDWVDFAYSETLDRWEAQYDGFTEGGLFRIQYHVKAGARYHASPRIGSVDRIGIPDAWENDNTAGTAQWLPINSVQGHNFHVANDEDWVRFTSPSGKPGTIAVVSPGPNCQPVVQLYRAADLDVNPEAAPIIERTAPRVGKEVVFDEYLFTTSEQYCLRVANADMAVYGPGTSYMLIVAVDTAGEFMPTTLIVTVLEVGKSAPIAGASVVFNNAVTGQTTGNGVVHFVCPSYGNYPVQASKTGYTGASQTVTVNNLVEQAMCYLQSQQGPIISVSPSQRDFGSVRVGQSADATFTVKNIGDSALSGEASVDAPFSVVLGGGSYSLGPNEEQIVTIRFTPSSEGNVTQQVTFTGGGGATCTVKGRGGSGSSGPSCGGITDAGRGSGASARGAVGDLLVLALLAMTFLVVGRRSAPLGSPATRPRGV